MNRSPEPWNYDGRHYTVTAFTDVAQRDGYGWELADVAPAPGEGVVLEAFRDDSTGAFTCTAFTDRPLPFALVHRFVVEAERGIPPRT